MKTKYQVLEGHVKSPQHIDEHIIDGYTSDVESAMDEYAKQQAIAFADWTAHNYVKYQKGGTWVCAGKVYEQPPTIDQVYSQFIESLNK